MARIYISLGTNIDREKHLENGLQALSDLLGKLTLSSLFESEAVGFNGNPFYNMVIGANTDLTIEQLVTRLKNIERDNGRTKNDKKFSPRTLDLDLLLYDNIVSEQPTQIPRGEISENAFVLWPLAEIAPNLHHPILNISYKDLWLDYDKSKQKLVKIPFTWSALT